VRVMTKAPSVVGQASRYARSVQRCWIGPTETNLRDITLGSDNSGVDGCDLKAAGIGSGKSSWSGSSWGDISSNTLRSCIGNGCQSYQSECRLHV
jgi:hypothetical protein